MNKVIMGWSKCSIEIGKSGDDGAMPALLKAMGVIKDKSTTLEATKGEELKAVASGGVMVAYEELDGGFALKTRIKEPDNALYETFGLGKVTAEKLAVKTHVVADNFAVKVTPKNVGATVLEAPYCNVSFLPGGSEDEGRYVDVTFTILPVLDENFEVASWYTLYKKAAIPAG